MYTYVYYTLNCVTLCVCVCVQRRVYTPNPDWGCFLKEELCSKWGTEGSGHAVVTLEGGIEVKPMPANALAQKAEITILIQNMIITE